jgi:hypothetical protein
MDSFRIQKPDPLETRFPAPPDSDPAGPEASVFLSEYKNQSAPPVLAVSSNRQLLKLLPPQQFASPQPGCDPGSHVPTCHAGSGIPCLVVKKAPPGPPQRKCEDM